MAATLSLAKSTPRRWRAFLNWRALVALLILSVAAYITTHSHPDLARLELILLALLLVFFASQIFWLRRMIDLGERFVPGKPRRGRVAAAVGLAYFFLVAYSFPTAIAQGHTFRFGFERTPNIVADAAFWWWFVGSIGGILVVTGFGAADRLARASTWAYRRIRRQAQQSAVASEVAPSSSRREFLRQAAVLVSATPFVASGYGLLYGREDVEVVRQRVRLTKLPKAFHGFRVAQLADVHMGPFADAAYVRRCVAITNELHPDLVALTGDFIAWDLAYVREVVRTLGGLHAPHGVFGCLGNHESESATEELITGLFAARGIRMLRQERAPVRRGDHLLNLIGIDDARGETEAEWRLDLDRRFRRELVMPGTVNVLLAHAPNYPVLDRASELGVDLVLAGHTHGGQLALESVHRGLNISRILYRYTSGWYEKNGTKLYVNRGVGTTGFPIRLGARPEITLFELTAA